MINIVHEEKHNFWFIEGKTHNFYQVKYHNMQICFVECKLPNFHDVNIKRDRFKQVSSYGLGKKKTSDTEWKMFK